MRYSSVGLTVVEVLVVLAVVAIVSSLGRVRWELR